MCGQSDEKSELVFTLEKPRIHQYLKRTCVKKNVETVLSMKRLKWLKPHISQFTDSKYR